jgi:ubiquitin-protein ligase
MSATSLHIKRTLRDLKIFYKDCPPGTFIYFDEADVTKLKVMVIGPKDTPYFGGFYCFDLNITTSFPLVPPEAKFLTTDGKIRIGPNIYENGKVCLSMLNTWGDKDWTPVQNLLNIVVVFQNILNDNPLNNEPNYYKSDKTVPQCYSYIGYVYYHNFVYSICHILQFPPIGELHQVMIDSFLENYQSYIDKCNELIKSEYNNIVANTIYGHATKLDFKFALNKLIETKKMIDNGTIVLSPLNKNYKEISDSMKGE